MKMTKIAGVNTDMNRDKYLAKIKKLLSLARGTANPEEAANAMAKAQAFMREYNLSEEAVALAEVKEASTAGAPSDAESMPGYMDHLCHQVCRAFGVDAYYSRKWRRSGSWKRIVIFYGPGERAEVAAYAFDVLTHQLKAARKDYQQRYCKRCKPATRVARGDKFCEGWVGGAAGVLQAFGMPLEEKNLIERYTRKLRDEQNFQDSTTRDARECRGADDAVSAGFMSGKNARLNHGVNGSASATLAIERR